MLAASFLADRPSPATLRSSHEGRAACARRPGAAPASKPPANNAVDGEEEVSTVRTLLTLLTIATLIVGAESSRAAEPSGDEAALRELKEVLWPKAYFEQDTELLDRILADDFQMIDGEGNWSTKAEEIKWVATNKPAYDSLVFEIKRLDIFDNGSAIVAGIGTIRGRDDEGAYVAEYQSTNVLIKRNGLWQAVASHVSGYRRK
jgi:hypothetical protein